MFFLKQTKEWSSCSWEVYGIIQERGTKIKRRGDTNIQGLCKHMDKILEVT